MINYKFSHQDFQSKIKNNNVLQNPSLIKTTYFCSWQNLIKRIHPTLLKSFVFVAHKNKKSW